MTLFEKARAWLPAMVQTAAGESVTYTRGADSITITAVFGRTVFASNADEGARIIFGDCDALVEVEDLTFGEPRHGDKITRTIDGTDVTFAIRDVETGEPAWRYSDPARTVWRIHLKRPS